MPPRKLPLWKYPPMKAPPCENYPPEFFPWENCPLWKFPSGKIALNEIPSPLINHKNERKNKITKLFVLKKTVQYNSLFDTQMISQKILGLDTFFTEWKKIQKPNESVTRQVAFTCQLYKSRRTRQSNYKTWQTGETTNSQLSMHSTLWILKKANRKMHALGRSVTIVYDCWYVLAAHVSIMYTLQIRLIRTNLKALPSYRELNEKALNERTR